jgi:hypothetical protein
MLGRHHDVVVLVDRCRGPRCPAPCAIQVPEVARTIGSSAVTRPLAGRWISITLSLRRVWM